MLSERRPGEDRKSWWDLWSASRSAAEASLSKINEMNGRKYVSISILTWLLQPGAGSAASITSGIERPRPNEQRGGAIVTKRLKRRLFSRGPIPSADDQAVLPVTVTETSEKPPSSSSTQDDALSSTAMMCMAALAIQFGVQPILVRKYTPQIINRKSVVLVQEAVKFVIAGVIYKTTTSQSTRQLDLKGWSVTQWISLAGLPAFLYTIQNVASLMAYQNLEPLTFNILNQTKILSAAFFCYLILGKRQSRLQMVALFTLVSSSLVIERVISPGTLKKLFSGASQQHTLRGRHITHGVVPVLVASGISGLAGALIQSKLQGTKKRMPDEDPNDSSSRPRNAYLYSMEMNIASILLLLGSMSTSSHGRKVLGSGFFDHWTPQTLIPVLSSSVGGILVGLVTKHAGSVRKGFALIFGLLLSGIFQAFDGERGRIHPHQIAGGLLASFSLYLHVTNPCRPT